MVGRTISHYKILEKLGEGGMGVVYKALDTNLNRTVALKFLPQNVTQSETDRKRFIHEAQAASSLEHPNICTIHEIEQTDDGQLFIVMPAYEGIPLNKKIEQGPLPINEAIDIAAQIAEGLQASHEKGIVHRDVKSSNIFITEKGRVKIMDFGLARSVDMTQVTKTGMTVGTVPYMSPEQARGDKIDHRTDIWSLGVILYEMLTGRRPFNGNYAEAVVYQILNEEPEPVTGLRSNVPMELERIVMKAMRKENGSRYQHVDELLTDLYNLQKDITNRKTSRQINKPDVYNRRRVPLFTGMSVLIVIAVLLLTLSPIRHYFADMFGKSPVAGGKGLAVLPFHNVSGRPDDQMLTHGLMETLTSQIAQMELSQGVIWVSPTVDIIEEKISTVREARQNLGVDLVLSGSVHRLANRIHLTLNLIDTATRRILGSWNGQTDMENLADLHTDLIIQASRMLELELRPGDIERLELGGTKNSKALAHYLEGQGNLQRFDKEENISHAIDLFTKAITVDPYYAHAHAGLAEALWRMHEITRDPQFINRAIVKCTRALELDERNPSAYITLGMIRFGMGEYDHAVTHFRRAIEIDPINPDAYRELARAYDVLGMPDQAEFTYKRAIRLNPKYWKMHNALGGFYINHNRYEEAIESFREVIALVPDNVRGYSNLGVSYHYLNQLDRARTYYERAMAVGKSYAAASNLGTFYYAESRFEEASQMYEIALQLRDTDYNVWGNLASAYYWTPGKREKARDAYLRAIELANERLEINPHDLEAIIRIAGFYAAIEDREQAFHFIRQVENMEPVTSEVMYRLGAAYERLGERAEALYWIEKSLRNGYSIHDVLAQPELEGLYHDERFQRMIKEISG